MEQFEEFIQDIEPAEHRARMVEVLQWVHETYPQLKPEFKWNQPIFTNHGTFIIGFSVSKAHISVAPEGYIDERFSARIKELGYTHGKKLIRIPFAKPVQYELLQEIIDFNMKDKADCTTFWRK